MTRDARSARGVWQRLLANGPMTHLPGIGGDLDLLLACAAAQVPAGRELRETEVNDSLRAWLGTFCAGGSADHVTLRRSLVDTGYLARDRAGATYWRSAGPPEAACTAEALAIDPAEVLAAVREEREARKRERAAQAMALRLRPIGPKDQAMLWEALHVALWDPPPAGLRPREVLEHPGVRLYAEGWGRPGDVGVAGVLPAAKAVVGACWMRLVPGGAGLAYVDESTPQLGIAVFPPFQRQGHGRALMRGALEAARAAGYRQVSLTVHPENPAIALYEACGFVREALRGTYHLMIAKL